MAEGEWTRERLVALARGRQVGARTVQAAEAEPPAWLLEHAVRRYPYDSPASLELMHPEDRPGLVDVFVRCLSSPGEVLSIRSRSSSGGRWHHTETLWLNLLDHDDVGSLLFFVADVDGPPIEPPTDDRIGEHAVTGWMVWTVSDTGHITTEEGACRELLGYEPGELVGRHLTELLPADTVADGVAMWVRLHERVRNTATNRRQWTRRDGSRIWIEDSYLNREDRDGDESVLVVLWDATDRVAQEEALRSREEELVAREAEKSGLAAQMQTLAGEMQSLARDFQILADEVPAAVFRCDASGSVSFHNARWTELVDGRRDVGRLHDIVAPQDHSRLDEQMGALVRSRSAERRALEVTSSDGTRTWRVGLRGPGDRSESLVGSIEDVSDTVELRRAARHDRLTDLPNRVALEEHLGSCLRDAPTDVVVFFVDLDGFKDVNDTWGHDVGDVVLAEVGQRLRHGVRPDDLVARHGGDEFVVVCTDGRDASPAAIGDRLLIALGGDIAFAQGVWQPAASIGWARGRVGDDTQSVLRRADVEMFRHKRSRPDRREPKADRPQAPGPLAG
jgi:diguanylate cyclase (GGDEF)-like protein/PAS domain S-box-containing protein